MRRVRKDPLVNTDHTETEVIEARTLIILTALRTAHTVERAVIGSTAHYPPRTPRRSPGAAIRRCVLVIRLIAILGPFLHISGRIVKTEGVGLKAADGCRAGAVPAAAAVKAVGGIRSCDTIPPECTRSIPPGGELPLRFRR